MLAPQCIAVTFHQDILAFWPVFAGLAALGLWIWKVAQNHDRKHVQLDAVPGRLDDIGRRLETLSRDSAETKGALGVLLLDKSRSRDVIDAATKMAQPAHGNPYDPIRRNFLLEKYRQGLLYDWSEIQELQRYLEEDKQKLGGKQDIGAILLVLAGLAALAWLLRTK